MQDVVQSSIRVTFADYIATLPPWERDLLVRNTEFHCPDYSLLRVTQQENVNIPPATAATGMTTAPLAG
jgi:hypothetical protein